MPPPTPIAEPPRRLHPFSMVRGIQLRQLLGAIPALFIIGDGGAGVVALLFGFVALLTITAVLRYLAWQRHTYEFRGGRIVERSGIVSRSERALEVERIQQVDVDRTLLDRAVGTCELRLETAADSGESELTLRVVSVEEAERLRGLLAARIGTGTAAPGRPDAGSGGVATVAATGMSDGVAVAPPTGTAAGPAPEVELVSVPLPHVALAAVTGPRLLAVPAAFAVVMSVVLENAAPDDIVDTAGDAVGALSTTAIGLLAVAIVVGSILLAAVTGVLRDGGFTIRRRGDDLLVRRGLTTTRSATVPMRRVQRVTVTRRWLQGRLGFASVTVHSAGGGGGEQGSQLDRSLTVPLLPSDEVDALVHQLLGVDDVPELRAHPPQARRRSVVRGALGSLALLVPLVGAGLAFEQPALFAVAAAVLLLGVVSGALAYERMASGADARAVASRTGLLGTTTEISPLRKTQGTSVTSTFFQRRLGLASLRVHVAGPAGGITLEDLGERTAERLAPTVHR